MTANRWVVLVVLAVGVILLILPRKPRTQDLKISPVSPHEPESPMKSHETTNPLDRSLSDAEPLSSESMNAVTPYPVEPPQQSQVKPPISSLPPMPSPSEANAKVATQAPTIPENSSASSSAQPSVIPSMPSPSESLKKSQQQARPPSIEGTSAASPLNSTLPPIPSPPKN